MIINKKNSGVALPLMVILLSLGVLIVALVVDIAFVANMKKQLSYVATLGAGEALRQYRESTIVGFTAARVNEAKASADLLLQENKIFGLGTISVGAGRNQVSSTYEFGVWHASVNAACATPPCFIPNATPAAANAVRLSLATRQSIGIFGPAVGLRVAPPTASAIITARHRCLEILVDVTGSVTQRTHISNLAIASTQLLSQYAFPDSVASSTCPSVDPSDPPPEYANPAQYIWCSMPEDAADFTHSRFDPYRTNRPETIHTRADYFQVSTPFRDSQTGPTIDYWIDGVTQPEPLRSVLLGINATVWEMAQGAAPGDRIRIRAFDQTPGGIHGNAIDVNVRDTRFFDAANLSYLLQITNFNNVNRLVGGVETSPPWGETHPNPIDVGFFPRTPAFTNIEEALRKGVNDLSDENVCTEESEKYLVLISDGIANCSGESQSSPNYKQCPFGNYQGTPINYCMYSIPGVNDTICGDTYHSWVAAAWKLENPHVGPPLRTTMQEEGIRLYYMGLGVSGPNVFNILHPDWVAPPSSPENPKFYDISQLVDYPGIRFEDITCCAYQANDFDRIGEDGVYFEEPNLLWMKWVLATGGKMLPIRPPPPADQCEIDTSINVFNQNDPAYRHEYSSRHFRTDVITNARAINTVQYVDPYCRSITTQVKNYILQDILGGSPFTPVALD